MIAVGIIAAGLWAATGAATIAALALVYLIERRRHRAEIARGQAQVAEFLAGAWEAMEDREGL